MLRSVEVLGMPLANVDEDGLLITSRGQCYVSSFELLGSDFQTVMSKAPVIDTVAQTIVVEVFFGTDLVNVYPDGSFRGLASKFLAGAPLGGVDPEGVREDDPNDVVPHEERRELRGQYVIFSWVDHTDVKLDNLLDMWVEDPVQPDVHYVLHYLIDFGNALGATGDDGKYVGEGYEGRVEWSAIFGRLLTLGLRYPYWMAVRRSPFPTVGIFESAVFDPARWAPAFPNPAFEEATVRDTFWAATVLARFDRARVAAAIGAARFGEPRAAQSRCALAQNVTVAPAKPPVGPNDKIGATLTSLAASSAASRSSASSSSMPSGVERMRSRSS